MLVHATYVQTELDPVTSVGSRNRDNQVVTHLNSHLLPKCGYFQMKIQIGRFAYNTKIYKVNSKRLGSSLRWFAKHLTTWWQYEEA